MPHVVPRDAHSPRLPRDREAVLPEHKVEAPPGLQQLDVFESEERRGGAAGADAAAVVAAREGVAVG